MTTTAARGTVRYRSPLFVHPGDWGWGWRRWYCHVHRAWIVEGP